MSDPFQTVVGIAREEQELRAVRDELGEVFTPVAAYATHEALAQDVIREHRPSLLVLNAGVAPHMAPVRSPSVHRRVRGRRVEAGRAGHSVRHAASAADTSRRRRLDRGRGLRRAPGRRPGHLRRRPAADPHVGPGRQGVLELASDPGSALEYLVSGADPRQHPARPRCLRARATAGTRRTASRS
jgi:hypothetical protein